MKVILSSVRNYPFKSGDNSKQGRRVQHLFYAQSWLAVHYLQSTKSAAGKSTDYLNRLNRGEAALAAFEAAYGMTPEQFGDVLKKYFKKNRYSTIRFKVTEREANPPITVRKLSQTEFKLAQADTLRYFHKSGQEAEVLTMLDDLSKQPDIAVEAYISKSKEAMTHQKYMDALAAAQSALDLGPNESKAKETWAISTVEAYLKFGKINGIDIDGARRALAAQLNRNGDNPMLHYYYAHSYSNTDNVSDDVIRSALYAAKRYRSSRFIWHRMQMARILMKGNKYGEARKIARFAKVWGRNRALRRSAGQMVDFINDVEAKYK